jgi:hypothetical protein
VSQDHLGQLDAIADHLTHAGMVIQDRVDEIGYLAGEAEDTTIHALKAVTGVHVTDEGDADRPDDTPFRVS